MATLSLFLFAQATAALAAINFQLYINNGYKDKREMLVFVFESKEINHNQSHRCQHTFMEIVRKLCYLKWHRGVRLPTFYGMR